MGQREGTARGDGTPFGAIRTHWAGLTSRVVDQKYPKYGEDKRETTERGRDGVICAVSCIQGVCMKGDNRGEKTPTPH